MNHLRPVPRVPAGPRDPSTPPPRRRPASPVRVAAPRLPNLFLSAAPSVELDTKTQNFAKGLFSGAGFFLLHAHGRGPLFIASYGAMHPIDLASGEEIVIDNGHLVAWQDNMDYDVQKSSSGWVSSLKSGEGVVCRFKGPGRILIQTRNPNAFGSWLSTIIPSSN